LLDPASRLTIVKFSSDQLILDVETKGPDRLVLNQNYDRGWKTNHGVIENYNDLLSVRFDKAFNGEIKASYLPKVFILGLTISVLALAGSVVFLIKAKK